jgi:MFS family permease
LRLLRLTATDLTPVRVHRNFRLLLFGNMVSSTGRQITVVALPFQVYSFTHSSLAVGGIGAAQILPFILMSLAGGSIADAVDRRRLLLLTNSLLCCCSAALTVAAFANLRSVVVLYIAAAVIAGLAAVDYPSRAAVIPNLVSREHLAPALSLNAVAQQITVIVGPALAGVLLAAFGAGPAYLIDAVAFIAVIAATSLIPPQPTHQLHRESTLRSVAGGLRFAWRHTILRSTFVLDIAAVVFGLRRALFPYLATTVYGVGATGLGVLYAAPGVGAVLAALASGWVARARRPGVICVGAAAGFGLSTLALGLAPSFGFAVAAVGIGGAVDAWSVVSRWVIVQTLTPDEMRGRISSIMFMSANAGNYLGDIEAGAAASLVSPSFSILSGGAAVIILVLLMGAWLPALFRYRAVAHPSTALPLEPE